MSIDYYIYTDMSVDELRNRLEVAQRHAGDLWISSNATSDLGPFHLEIIEEFGVSVEFKSRVYAKHNKFQSVEAKGKMLEFYHSLPGRKLILNGDALVGYSD